MRTGASIIISWDVKFSLLFSFDFCEPDDESKDKDPVENLGQVVFGERLRASGYDVSCEFSSNPPHIAPFSFRFCR